MSQNLEVSKENIIDSSNNALVEKEIESSKASKFFSFKPLIFAMITLGLISIGAIIFVFSSMRIKNVENMKLQSFSVQDDQSQIKMVNFDITKKFDFTQSIPKIEAKYNEIGTNDDDTLETFCNYLNNTTKDLTDIDKVYYAYYWVGNNIAYDVGYFTSIPKDFFKKKATVCLGYALILKELLLCMNYNEDNIKTIPGIASVDEETTEDTINHYWNAVKIGKDWCLIDPTWSAGSVSGRYFKRYFNHNFLCPLPGDFVRSHLPHPNYKQFQLLDSPVDLQTFKEMLTVHKTFYELGFVGLGNDKKVQNICGEGKFVLKYNNPNRPYISVYLRKGSNYYSEWVMTKKITNGYEINFYINEEGTYTVQIYAGYAGQDLFERIIEFKINCDSTPVVKKYYPYFYSAYKEDDNIALKSPMDNYLEQGKKYTFEIETSSYNELYLRMGIGGISEPIIMEKQGNVFKGTDVFVHGNYVTISYLKNGYWSDLVEYSTTGELIEFPRTMRTTFIKKLESPLASSLKLGQTYLFKIICDATDYIVIFYNDQRYPLEKNGNVFTKELTVTGSLSDLDIYYAKDGQYLALMYYYKISE